MNQIHLHTEAGIKAFLKSLSENPAQLRYSFYDGDDIKKIREPVLFATETGELLSLSSLSNHFLDKKLDEIIIHFSKDSTLTIIFEDDKFVLKSESKMAKINKYGFIAKKLSTKKTITLTKNKKDIQYKNEKFTIK